MNRQGKKGEKGRLIIVIPIVVLAAFAVLIAYMMLHLQADETTGTRALYHLILYGGAEAFTFAAAWFLFGKEVSRERADKAESRAESARQEASQAQQQVRDAQQKAATAEAETRHIVKTVRAQATRQKAESKSFGVLGVSDEQADAVQAALQQLARAVDVIDQA